MGSSHTGMENPSRLATSPDAVPMISGLRTSSRAKPLPACRAMGHTAPTLNSGTHTPMSTAIISSPCGPATLPASANAMNELKRNPIWALAACKRTSSFLPSHGQWGNE